MEHDSTKNSLDRTTAIVGFAIIFALLLAFAAYFVVQVNQINNKLSVTGNNAEIIDRLGALERRVASLEAGLNTQDPIQLKLFYDSSDNYTSDVINRIAESQARLASQNLAVTLVDRKNDIDQYRKDGFNAVPYLFISDEQARRDPTLAQNLLQETRAFDGLTEGYRVEALGFVFDRKNLIETECKTGDGKVNLDWFTQYPCPFCAGMYSQVVDFVSKTGDKINYRQRHNPLSNTPNSFNASVAAECARDQGKFDAFSAEAFLNNKNLSMSKFKEIGRTINVSDIKKFDACVDGVGERGLRVNRDQTEAYVTYGLRSAPVFVLDCKYAFVALTESQLKNQVCRAKPGLCSYLDSKFPELTATPTPKAG